MQEGVDDLLAQLAEGWDFWIGSDWGDSGTIYEVRLLKRAPDHPGHHLTEINTSGRSLRDALVAALTEAKSGE